MATTMQRLDNITGSRRYSAFVCWYCTPQDKRDSWEKISELTTFNNVPWDYVEKNWILDENIQAGIKYYMKLQHHEKMKNIYDKMYEQALNGDVQSAKYLMDFSKDFFADDNRDELNDLLGSIDLDGDEDGA